MVTGGSETLQCHIKKYQMVDNIEDGNFQKGVIKMRSDDKAIIFKQKKYGSA